MVEAAKTKGRPVIAANTTWEIVRFLRGNSYDALRVLTAEQQRLFRIPESEPEGRYRADFDALMTKFIAAEHAPPNKGAKSSSADSGAAQLSDEELRSKLDGRFRAQSLWDWTMAESVVRAVDAGARPVFHVIGRFHSDFRGGTAQAIAKLRPGTKLIVISVVDADSTSVREEDEGRADFVVYVGPSQAD
jgi:uncharacterized iron-regulated protein